MPYPRHAQVSAQTTPYYHCISRCVRRAFLCGLDRLTGRSYEHRKQWIVERLELLSAVFTIDVCAYAVMANHHHVVLRLDPDRARALSEEEVMTRWAKLFQLPAPLVRYRYGLTTGHAEARAARARIETYRERLCDLSWFMRCLNEPIARRANAEDGCTGRFWEGRFKSQALLDEAALVTCMSYVDLNPVRAGIADTPEQSDFTAIQARIREWHAQQLQPMVQPDAGPSHAAHQGKAPMLLPFRGPERRDAPEHLPFAFTDYLELLDWTGRAVREDKTGAIPADTPAILTRLGIEPQGYIAFMRARQNGFARAIGRAEALRRAATDFQQRFLKGIAPASALFRTATG